MKFKSIITYLILILTTLSACKEKEKVESHIPTSYSGLTKLNLPTMKSKLLSWELIKNYILSNSDDRENFNFSIDTDRPAYIGHNKQFDTTSIFFAIDNIGDFEQSIESIALQETAEINGYKVTEIEPFNEFKYIIWSSDVAIISTVKDGFSNKKDSINQIATRLSKETYDISSKIYIDTDNGEGIITQHTNFEEGHLSTIIDADEPTKDYILAILSQKTTNKNTLCFTTDSCILGISTKIEPKVLNKNITHVMSYLQQYGVLFNDQYDIIKPYFDGRLYLGLSKIRIGKGLYPEAKIAFGMKEGYRQTLDSTTLQNMDPCPDSDYLVDQEDFQYILPKNDYIIYSNHNESNTSLLQRPTILNLQVNKDLINEQLFAIPRSYFGNDVVNNYPFSNIEFDVHEKETHLESTLIIKCKDQSKNSLETIINYIQLIRNRDEV